MYKTTLNYRNFLWNILILVSITSFHISLGQGSPDTLNECEFTGTVFQISSDVGGFQIHLDDGRWIIPVAESVPDFFSDSLRVRVSFKFLDDSIGPCLSCNYVYLTCAMMIPTPYCRAMIEAHPLDILENSTSVVGWFPYEFIDVSIGTVKERAWFIDGDSIFGDQSIIHIFHEPGYHKVCLIIETDEGCRDSFCMDLFVGSGEECYADFEYYPLDGVIYPAITDEIYFMGYPYQFYDKSRGDVIDWQWTINSDTILGDPSPVYTFHTPGQYTVCLTITTSDQCVSTICKSIIVGQPDECMAMFEYYAPLDDTNWSPDFPGSRVIQFVDMSKGNITNWFWDFGDGTYSEEQSPLHEFPYSGKFEVCLAVMSPDGCEDRYCTIVYVEPVNECRAYFEYCSYYILSPDATHDPGTLIIGFSNQSFPNAVHSEWDFGDGTHSTEHSPLHVYQQPGIYRVCLSIYTADGCFDNYCKSVYVGIEECKVDFTHELIAPDCWGYEIAYYFSVITTEKPWSYSWDFGDGHYAYEAEVAHIYNDEGIYDVCLEVNYANGCVAKKCKVIYNSVIINDSVYFEKCNPSVLDPVYGEQILSISGVYPVPASDILNIEIISQNRVSIDVNLVNVLGQYILLKDDYILSTGKNQLELQLDALEPGTYIYVISSSESIIRGRVSIIK